MSAFFEELFTSIFTPGPTPTLLVATNVAFGSLQVLLVALLAGTRSVHFAILSVLCGGLWWSINWFAKEIQAAQQEQAKTADGKSKAGPGATERKDFKAGPVASQGGVGLDGETAESEDTETEAEEGRIRPVGAKKTTGAAPGSSSGLKPQADDAKKRLSSGDVSGTDSEWEKLSESEIRH